jgi:hypothetical protein
MTKKLLLSIYAIMLAFSAIHNILPYLKIVFMETTLKQDIMPMCGVLKCIMKSMEKANRYY